MKRNNKEIQETQIGICILIFVSFIDSRERVREGEEVREKLV